MTLLSTELEQFKTNQRKNISAKVLGQLEEAIEGLKHSNHFSRRLRTGDTAPDFALTNCHGQTFTLANVLREAPVVLSFFRGGWCGYDTLELQHLQRIRAQINECGARLLCIAPAKPENLSAVQREYGLDFDLLFDEANRVGELFGIAYPIPQIVRTIYEAFDLELPEENGDDSYRLPLPVTYVINQEGTVVLDYFNHDYTQRLEPSNILEMLMGMQVRCVARIAAR